MVADETWGGAGASIHMGLGIFWVSVPREVDGATTLARGAGGPQCGRIDGTGTTTTGISASPDMWRQLQALSLDSHRPDHFFCRYRLAMAMPRVWNGASGRLAGDPLSALRDPRSAWRVRTSPIPRR
jgi:hypothetical protein